MSNLPYLDRAIWRRLRAVQIVALAALDVAIVWISTFLAFWARFSGAVTPRFIDTVIPLAAIASVVFVLLFWLFKLYHQVWRHVGVDVIVKLAYAVALGVTLLLGGNLLLSPDNQRYAPIGTILIMGALVFIGSATIRAFGRLLLYAQQQGADSQSHTIAIVGAGDAGSILLRDIENRPSLGLKVECFIDDDRGKHGRFVRNVPVAGGVDKLPEIVARRGIAEVFIAIPSATSEERARILEACAAAGVPVRLMKPITVDPLAASVQHLREVSIEDLLGRDPVDIDVEQVARTLTDRVVLVTGAAGSIGSELARQVCLMKPKRLLLVDVDESRLYETWIELRQSDPDVPQMEICDVRDEAKVQRLFDRERPEVVLHAAAYKHVPLMEIAPDEAVKANVLGTRNIIRACEAYDAERFVLISTDKAVCPSSFMGVTKAIAEQQMLAACRRGLNASAVRFGNVLGSRGSVVPLFEEQLRRGGPLLVTHPDITRYFMTIREAARLVLQAQAISEGGDIFVLEMGEPVKIVDLAKKMIVLSGVDTNVEFIGLRPAEKLHETLVHEEEDLLDTSREKVLRVNALSLPGDSFESMVDSMIAAAAADDRGTIHEIAAAIVPTFTESRAAAAGPTN